MKTFIETVEGFDIHFEALEGNNYMEQLEFLSRVVKNFRDCKETKDKTIKQLDSGELVLFCAKVTATKAGIELGCIYLEMCIRETIEEFYPKYKTDYFSDMKDSAIEEAKEKIKELINN